jgi:predicted O-methyltransferase YrrM
LPRSRPTAKRHTAAKRRAARHRRTTGPAKIRAKSGGHKRLLTEAEAASWYAGKSFNYDWTSWHFPNWIPLLEPYRNRAIRVLEIGSWEGRSALFFLNYLPRARLTCVDTFEGGQEHRHAARRSAADARELRAVERRFDANTARFVRRIEKIKARSADALAALGIRKARYDIAYVDGSHRAADVYSDAVLTWPLMARGGMVIFDDYQWDQMPNRLDNPKPGIDAFLKAAKGQYRLVLNSYQIAVVKR